MTITCGHYAKAEHIKAMILWIDHNLPGRSHGCAYLFDKASRYELGSTRELLLGGAHPNFSLVCWRLVDVIIGTYALVEIRMRHYSSLQLPNTWRVEGDLLGRLVLRCDKSHCAHASACCMPSLLSA